MRLLVIGGTMFVGRHVVEAAVAAGHEVAVFHRGRTNADLLADRIDHRVGDRDGGDYSALEGTETWDALVDVSAYIPRAVNQLADAIGSRVGHHVHVSSISAYDDARITPDEDAPLLADLADPTVEDVTGETYGALKAMCERAALQRFGEDRAAIVRPTFVCGPHDPTDRFTYWVRRLARGGDVVVLATGTPLQIVDARDLGAFVVKVAAEAVAGSFDGVGPYAGVTDLFTEITPDGADTAFVEVSAAELDAAQIKLPLVSESPEALMTRPGSRARAAGLVTRAAADTAAATREWDTGRGETELKVGPSAEQEADFLDSLR